MSGKSCQAYFDPTTLLSIIVFAVEAYVLFWFYSAVKRVEKSLEQMKARMESLTKNEGA